MKYLLLLYLLPYYFISLKINEYVWHPFSLKPWLLLYKNYRRELGCYIVVSEQVGLSGHFFFILLIPYMRHVCNHCQCLNPFDKVSKYW